VLKSSKYLLFNFPNYTVLCTLICQAGYLAFQSPLHWFITSKYSWNELISASLIRPLQISRHISNKVALVTQLVLKEPHIQPIWRLNTVDTNIWWYLMRSMSVHCIIQHNKHQLMHQNIYNLYLWKSPTCFDPAGPYSGRIVLIHYGCVYSVKCECALGVILRLRGTVYCQLSVSVLFRQFKHRPPTVHGTSQTEDYTQGTFTLNCTNANIVYQNCSPWRKPSGVETCRRLSRIKITYILVH
jgi:hypothetical protein